MIRVLHVIGKMDRAGAETMIMNIYRNIDRAKVQFDFLVFSEEEADYNSEIVEMGGHIYHMPGFRFYNYLDLYKRFRKFFKSHAYSIVHGHIGSLSPAYLKCAKKAGAFTIAHSHGTKSSVFKNRVLYTALTYWVRFIADYFMACSKEAGIDRFGKDVVSSDRFQIIHNSIDSKKYCFSEERQNHLKEKFGMQGKKIYGHVGRFANAKNHSFILEIFSVISQNDKNSILILVGKGSLETNIRKLAETLGIKEKVIFLGSRSDVPDIMNLMDVFLFPSLFEGFGIVGLEAQAAGLPCFFSEAVPDESIVTDNVWKYPLTLSAEKWAVNIQEALSTYTRKNENEKITKAGFDIAQTAAELQEFYLNAAK